MPANTIIGGILMEYRNVSLPDDLSYIQSIVDSKNNITYINTNCSDIYEESEYVTLKDFQNSQ
jgi:hypothetical protein